MAFGCNFLVCSLIQWKQWLDQCQIRTIAKSGEGKIGERYWTELIIGSKRACKNGVFFRICLSYILILYNIVMQGKITRGYHEILNESILKDL